jgi:hypothetical protein
MLVAHPGSAAAGDVVPAGISVPLNGTVHYLESTHTLPSWLLLVAVATVPPPVLGLCVPWPSAWNDPTRCRGNGH